MGKLVIHNEKIVNKEAFIQCCPFSAMEIDAKGQVNINAACKMCRVCVKKAQNGEVEFVDGDEAPAVDKSLWRGVCVYVDHVEGKIHPVTYELIGKARELADKIHEPVYALFIGSGITEEAKELLHYPVDEIAVFDEPELRDFRIEPYTALFEEFIKKYKPGSILVGATTVGRQLAPRVAARMGTGLTADCTILDMEQNTDLSQIRPAFGGNIMAHIFTPRTRPQMATVRYKIMQAAPRREQIYGKLTVLKASAPQLVSRIEILSVEKKPKVKSIEQADIIVAAGRGIKRREDLEMIEKLAELIGGEIAGTRPLIEAGWLEPRRQIGLSGRTVRPKLIITCGISGAVQFCAGMSSADNIIAINSDPAAPIFSIAHTAAVGDIYEIVPRLIDSIKAGKAGHGNV